MVSTTDMVHFVFCCDGAQPVVMGMTEGDLSLVFLTRQDPCHHVEVNASS